MQSPPRRRASLSTGETALWCLLALLLIVVRLHMTGGPAMWNDSYQYLSVADNFRHGHLAKTSIVHFDVERSHGQIPAHFTTFPPGYPLVISVLASTGISAEYAGQLWSLAAACALVPLIVWTGTWMSLSPAVVRTLLALLISNSPFAMMAGYVATEPVFTAMTFAAVLFFLKVLTAAQSDREFARWHLAANLLVGLAYWVRYAGLFLFASTTVFFALRWITDRTWRSLLALASTFLAFAIIAAGLVRNYLLAGTWTGGNTKEVSHDALAVLRKFARSIHYLFLGQGAPATLGFAEAAFFLALAVLAGAAIPRLWQQRHEVLSDARLQFVALFVSVYTGAMLYLGVRSVISFGPRMFLPLLPVLLLFGALLLSRTPRPERQSPARHNAAIVVLVLLAGSAASINFLTYLADPKPRRHQVVRSHLEAPLASGASLMEWIGEHVPPDATIVATNGQATGYVLQRKTISLVSSTFSDQKWTDEAVRAVMARFGGDYLIVYYGAKGRDPVLRDSGFIAGLIDGAVPGWLGLLADNGQVKIFGRVSA